MKGMAATSAKFGWAALTAFGLMDGADYVCAA